MLDRLLFDEVHPKRGLEWDRVFLDVAGDDISNQERGKILFTNGQFPSGADSSGISLEVFIQYADACYSIIEHSFLVWVATISSAASRLSLSSSSLIIFRVAIVLSRKTTDQ